MKNLISKCIVYGLNGHNFSLESVSMPGGRIVNTAENGEIMFVPMMYFTDNLGSIRSVVEATSGTELKHYDYYPYGLEWGYDHKDNSSEYRYKFNGKEDQGMFGVDYLDYGARLYDPYIASWISPDPLSRKYPNISPYVFCNNNPVNFVDPDGRDWYSYTITKTDSEGFSYEQTCYKWTEAKSQEELNAMHIQGTYEGSAVVVFNGSYDECLGENQSLLGRRAKLAQVIVYGPKNEKDVKYYRGYTMSSDPSRFGVLANGKYTVYQVDIANKGPYDSVWAINNRKEVPVLNDFNPAHPERIDPAFLDGGFVHRNNWNGFAGTYVNDNGEIKGVSEGCLLILAQDWDSFNNQLISVKQFKLVLNRK